jgi:hypothetical protein
MKSPIKWLKILIFNYPLVKPLVKRPNKKPKILNFTTDGAPFFFFPICKKHQYPFLSLLFSSPQLLLFSFMLMCMYSSPFFFFFSVFLINILYELFFLFLATCNHIKVRFFFFLLFSCFFSLYLLFYF